jgi:hypothetical protein
MRNFKIETRLSKQYYIKRIKEGIGDIKIKIAYGIVVESNMHKSSLFSKIFFFFLKSRFLSKIDNGGSVGKLTKQ